MEPSIFQQKLFWWALGLVVGLPSMVIALGEFSERLERRGNPLAQGLRQVRYGVIPLLTMLFIVQQIFSLSGSQPWLRVIETLFWISVLSASLTFIFNLTQFGQQHPAAWVNRTPVLIFALARAIVVFCVASHVLAGIWGFELGQVTTVVGIGSMVIALALQDTLSNLVSGFLLLADRPFKVGDYIVVDGQWMAVEDIGWRTTRFTNFDDDGLVIVPNGNLGKQTIVNYGQEGSRYLARFYFKFSYDDPPNLVKQVLSEVLQDVDRIIPEPAPDILLYEYQEYAIQYRVSVYVDFWDMVTVWDQIKTKMYYAAKRYKLTIPLPARTLHHVDSSAVMTMDSHPDIVNTLRTVPLFRTVPPEMLQRLAAVMIVRHYGAGERVMRQGEPDEGIYIVQSGSVVLTVCRPGGQEAEMTHLAVGDVFGELALLPGELSPMAAIVTTDAYVLIIDDERIIQLVGENNLFARDMNLFIEERQRTLHAFLNMEHQEQETEKTFISAFAVPGREGAESF